MSHPTDDDQAARRRTLGGLAGMAGLAGITGPAMFGMLAGVRPAAAQAPWKPPRPIRLVVPYPPGGSVDVLARLVAPGLGDRIGQPVVVDYKPGATGTLGANFVYTAPPDGTTLLFGVSDPLSIIPNMMKTPYDPAKFVPIARVGSTPFVLIARPGLPIKDFRELIDLARSKQLSYANAGMGGSLHLMTAAFGRAAKIENMLHVPFSGGAPAVQALMGDQVDIGLTLIGGAIQHRSRLRFFGVSASQRATVAPDVPTFTEQGLPLVREVWMGVLAPPGTPANIIDALGKALAGAVADSGYKAKTVEMAMEASAMTTPEFTRYYFDEIKTWGEVIRASNIKME